MLFQAVLGLVSASAVLATHSTVNVWLASSWNAPPLVLEVLYVLILSAWDSILISLRDSERVSQMKIQDYTSRC